MSFKMVPQSLLVLAICSAFFAGTPAFGLSAFFYSFAPWDAVMGRDGNFYGETIEGGSMNGGTVYKINRAGSFRNVSNFRRTAWGGSPRTWGCNPEGGLGVGADGALYGSTRDGGAFGQGVLFKIDLPTNRLTVLHHYEDGDSYKGQVIVARDGTIYALVKGRYALLRLSKDGSYKQFALTEGYAMGLCETAAGEILVGSAEEGNIWRLNFQTDEFELLAHVGHYPRAFLPLSGGGIVGLVETGVFYLTPQGTFGKVYQIGAGFQGMGPNSLFFTSDGSLLGSTGGGGLQAYGTQFQVPLQSSAVQVFKHLAGPHPNGAGVAWLNEVYPSRVFPPEANLEPAAKDDIVLAASLKIPKAPAEGVLPQVLIDVLKNDRDANKDELVVTDVGNPTHGTAVLDPSTQRIRYTSKSATVENDEFFYTVSDGRGGATEARVSIRTSPAGKYSGDIITVPNSVAGDPGTQIGLISLRLSATKALAGQIELYGKKYSLSGKFNEANQFAKPLFFDPRIGERIGVQLLLRLSDSKWVVEASFQKNGRRSRASCNLIP